MPMPEILSKEDLGRIGSFLPFRLIENFNDLKFIKKWNGFMLQSNEAPCSLRKIYKTHKI